MQEQILVVEEDGDARLSICMLLQRAGFKVVSVSQGQDARKYLMPEDHRPQVAAVITDIRMPGYSGIRLIDDVLGTACDIPAVVISGYGDRKTRQELKRKGCRYILGKPIVPEQLIEMVHTALRQAAKKQPTAVSDMT
jgi:two-component system C4-dicarboxylate transport response regulator DctD